MNSRVSRNRFDRQNHSPCLTMNTPPSTLCSLTWKTSFDEVKVNGMKYFVVVYKKTKNTGTGELFLFKGSKSMKEHLYIISIETDYKFPLFLFPLSPPSIYTTDHKLVCHPFRSHLDLGSLLVFLRPRTIDILRDGEFTQTKKKNRTRFRDVNLCTCDR